MSLDLSELKYGVGSLEYSSLLTIWNSHYSKWPRRSHVILGWRLEKKSFIFWNKHIIYANKTFLPTLLEFRYNYSLSKAYNFAQQTLKKNWEKQWMKEISLINAAQALVNIGSHCSCSHHSALVCHLVYLEITPQPILYLPEGILNCHLQQDGGYLVGKSETLSLQGCE